MPHRKILTQRVCNAKYYDCIVIEAMEEEIREAHPGEDLIFPPSYPRCCLLGRVEVTDCVSNEEYMSRDGPHEDNDSDYLLLCKDFERLVLPIHMPGEHKLWRLPHSLVQNLVYSLKPVVQPFE